MKPIYRLETARVTLRQWERDDYIQFAKMNADAEVMRYFPSTLSIEESDAFTKRLDDKLVENGWGFWVAERKEDQAFLGLVGLNYVDDLPIPSCVEVGWRLARAYWGEGYATETAVASLHFAFSVLNLDRVAAFTAVDNLPSRRLMSRLGMVDRLENFQHPRVADGSALKEHVYYDLTRETFYSLFPENAVTISVD
ncbi:MAG: N-acetyltransferase [Pseudohongiella sp.]|nr:MAG: N-acetyltransferase [Pseudohongiella sp.]